MGVGSSILSSIPLRLLPVSPPVSVLRGIRSPEIGTPNGTKARDLLANGQEIPRAWRRNHRSNQVLELYPGRQMGREGRELVNSQEESDRIYCQDAQSAINDLTGKWLGIRCTKDASIGDGKQVSD
ncbi:hypothetical protein L1987_87336 [Smallanthus sonchifolius]|nr:hypothetical protein L1987_87336 [Smallanthus sonchifolius]